jgi:diguanylate cyclase (GGDEF)-like protein
MGPIGPRSGEVAPRASSWLCRDDFDRQRMLDMEERVRGVRRRTFAVLVIALVAMGPWLGWWPVLFWAPISGVFAMADRLMPRLARPEYLMFAAWIASEAMFAGVVALDGGPGTPILSWLAIPIVTLSTRFSMRGVVAGVAIAMGLVLAVTLGVDAHAVSVNPALAVAPLSLIGCVAVLSTPLMRSDIQHRSAAVIDPLTGMLNRKALSTRVHELAQQSQATGEPVGLVVGDIDHFKRVNDTRGHAAGDVVLHDVAALLRKQLRAFDLAYRLGGEEFLIVVPGADLDRSAELAEQLHEALVDDQRSGGIPITMSFGVGASGNGEAFDYASVFAMADAALYDAKLGGRDQVCVAGRERALAPV